MLYLIDVKLYYYCRIKVAITSFYFILRFYTHFLLCKTNKFLYTILNCYIRVNTNIDGKLTTNIHWTCHCTHTNIHGQLTTSIHWPWHCTHTNIYGQLTTSIHWPCHCTLHFYVVFKSFVIVSFFCVEANLRRFFFIACRWRSSCQEKRGGIHIFLPVPRTWISNLICRDLIMFSVLRWVVSVRFVDTDGIVDNHCLNVLFISVRV